MAGRLNGLAVAVRLVAALRALRGLPWGDSRDVRGAWPALLPGSRFDYASEIGDPTENAVAAIALGWIADNLPESRFCLTRGDGVSPGERLPSHPLVRLLRRPNPSFSYSNLMAATSVDYSAHGNAFWYKARPRGGGKPVELWWLPQAQVKPWSADSSAFLSKWIYTVDGREIELDPKDVVHFKFGCDPDDHRLGRARLRPVGREIATDNSLATLTAAICRNGGIPLVMIAPGSDKGEISPGNAKRLQDGWSARYAGEGAGKPFVSPVPIKVERLSQAIAELDLRAIRAAPESRICAALRISPLVVGLATAQSSATFSNFRTARRQSYEDCILPLLRAFGDAVDLSLLPEWEGDRLDVYSGFDTTGVVALQEERTEVYRQCTLAVRGGWMMVNDARSRAGLALDPGPDGLMYRLGGAGFAGSPDKDSGDVPQADGSASESVGGEGL